MKLGRKIRFLVIGLIIVSTVFAIVLFSQKPGEEDIASQTVVGESQDIAAQEDLSDTSINTIIDSQKNPPKEVIIRQPTAPYPDTPRSEWALGWLERPNYQDDKLLHFAYAVWESVEARDAGELPFFLNSHKAMVREQHQRIKTDIDGNFMHTSGAAVSLENFVDFLETDPRAVKYVKAGYSNLVEWEDDKGNKSTPFVFKSYWGDDEALDPQWQREVFIVPQAEQVEALISERLDGVEARQQTGDHRGTTLDLQVGAGADDGYTVYTPPSNNPGTPDQLIAAAVFVSTGTAADVDGKSRNSFHRFTGVSGLSGATIDVAYYSLDRDGSTGTITAETVIGADDSAAPAAYTTKEQHDGAVRTTASVVWNPVVLTASPQFADSPSLVSVIQELADSYDPSTIIILHDDTLKTNSTNHARSESYEGLSTGAAKLHIEYTAIITDFQGVDMQGIDIN